MSLGVFSKLTFRDWRFLNVALIWIYEGAPQDEGVEWVNDSHYAAWKLLHGQATVEFDAEVYRIKRDQWVVFPPSVYKRSFSADAEILSLHFEARWITGQWLFGFHRPQIFDGEEGDRLLHATAGMLQIVRRYFPDASNRLPFEETDYDVYTDLHGRFQRWLVRLWTLLQQRDTTVFTPTIRDERAWAMKYWIEGHTLSEPFLLRTMASHFGLSSSQVNRIFTAEWGMTPRRYFEQRRLKSALSQLEASSARSKEISYSLGFRHQSEFSNWLKKHIGQSPTEYRRSL